MESFSMLRFQTPDGKVLTRGTADNTDVGPTDAGLVVIEDKVYTIEEAKKLSKKIYAAIDLALYPHKLPSGGS